MINAEFLASCSEEQINRGVAWLTIEEWGADCKHKRKSIDYYCSQGLLNSINAGNVNYCTNPNDIMPIAFANAISLETFDGSLWWADAPIIKDDLLEKTITSKELKNPLRAICEVYILMSVNK